MAMPTIVLANDTNAEIRCGQQLSRLLQAYPLERWLHTSHVRIDERVAIPHSHPVLTLSTAYADDESLLLSTYVHEQLHWYVAWPGERPPIFNELWQRYQSLPIEPPEGCGKPFSNLVHLVVNTLEYVSLVDLLGADPARELLRRKHYYRAIYRTVLADHDELVRLITRQGWVPLP